MGKPVYGAAVSVNYRPTLLPLKNDVTITKPDGSFVLENLPEGTYRVDGLRKGPITMVGHVDNVKVGASGDAKPIRIELLSEGGRLESYVYEMANGKPLPAAWCQMAAGEQPFGHNSKRDDAGKLVVHDIPAGTYTVQIGAYSFSNVKREVDKGGEGNDDPGMCCMRRGRLSCWH